MIIIDANILTALIIPLPYTKDVEEKFNRWTDDDVELAAPFLYSYEVATSLRKAVAWQHFTREEVIDSLRFIESMDIQAILPTTNLLLRAIEWAEKIGQPVAYDAQYLAAAEEYQADLWTADRKLATAARKAGASWVHWIGES